MSSSSSSPNVLNYLNLVGYILNTVITFFADSIFGFPDNAELSEKYQTIVTPAGYAFAIWGIIFISQAVFTIVQLLPKYCQLSLIQDGVGYWYFITCIVQAVWTFAFGYEVIVLSAIVMFGILASLLTIFIRQNNIVSSSDSGSDGRTSPAFEYWLLRFPFSIHAGWIVAASAVNLNVIAVADEASSSIQLVLASFGLIWIIFFAIVSTFYGESPEYAIPAVGSWATLAIGLELQDPNDAILNTFDEVAIQTIRVLSFIVSACLLAWCIGFAIYGRCCRRGNVGTHNDGNDGTSPKGGTQVLNDHEIS